MALGQQGRWTTWEGFSSRQLMTPSIWSVRLDPVEVGARGFVGDSTTHLLKDPGLQGARLHKATRELPEEAEKGSFCLWLRRRDRARGATNSCRRLAAGAVRETSLFTAPLPADVLG